MTSSLRRVGVIGPPFDPLGQLLEDQMGREGDLFLPLVTPVGHGDPLDEIVLLSQNEALAHFADVAASDVPCTVMLRRIDGTQSAEDWAANLRVLRHCLDGPDTNHVTLMAVTEDAALEMSDLLGRPVGLCPSLVSISPQQTRFPINRAQAEAVFFLDQREDTREARRMERQALSWAKLRRLAQIAPEDGNDQDMVDLAAYANGFTAEEAVPAKAQKLKLLAVVPNGVGLGHITRMMALAAALKEQREVEVLFWCFSRAAEILQAAGYPIVLRQTAMHLQAHPPDWRAFETQEFALLVQSYKPDMVSYDGANIDRFVFDALRMPGCGKTGFLWVRRGMLRPDSDPLFMENEQFCDLILEPGDLAVAVDKGPTRTRSAHSRGFCQSYESAPVSLAVGMPSYTRTEAKARMKLGAGKHCLVSLGGAYGDWDALESALVAQAQKHKIGLIWAQSPLAAPPRTQGTLVRRLFPLSRYLTGIDGVVTATGYNSFHELMLTYDKPVLFAPTNHIRMDDQVARASYAAEQGWASIVQADAPDGLEQKIDAFMQQVLAGDSFPNRPKPRLNTAALDQQIALVLTPFQRHGQPEDAL